MRCRAAACLSMLALPAFAIAQSGMSQARMEADCLQRLQAILPGNVASKGVDFSALGNYAVYYVVTYRFSGELKNGGRSAACTYRRNGEWVKDDATSYTITRELDSARPRAKTP